MKLHRRLALLLALASAFSLVLNTGAAYALYCDAGGFGRAGCHGFFTNGNADYYAAHDGSPADEVDDVIEAGLFVSSANEFLTQVNANLYASSTRKQMGAAFIIDGMLGYHNPTSRTNGINWAKSHWSLFEQRVRQYANSNSTSYGVDWNRSTSVGGRNSAYFAAINDDAFHEDSGSVAAIYFYWPGGSFAIQRNCANLIGSLNVPPPRSWDPEPTTLINKTTMNLGDTVTWTHNVKNVGSYKTKDLVGDVYWRSDSTGALPAATFPSATYRDLTNNSVVPNKSYGPIALAAGASISASGITYSFKPTAIGKYCQAILVNWTSSSDSTNQVSAEKCVTVTTPPGPNTVKPKVEIINTTHSGADYIEPGDSFKADGSLESTASSTVKNTVWEVWLETNSTSAGATKDVGEYSSFVTSGTLGAGTITFTGTKPAGTTTGQVTIALANTANFVCARLVTEGVSPTDVDPPEGIIKCLPIQTRPFFQVTGGDVNAAAVMKSGGSCPTSSNGLLAGWNNGTSGANTNIAAFAAQAITEFASHNPPIGLTFANTPATPWGGEFDEVYCVEGVTSDPSIPPVFIDAAGTYNGSVSTAGDIIISNNVTIINGIFKAGGNIYTCGTAIGPTLAVNMKTACSNKLTVNGSFTANTIYLLRTLGSLGNGEPAEQFNYGPEVWLPGITPSGGGSIDLGDADSVTSLPPVL